VRTRTFVVVGVVVALLIAGVASYFASANPDGLEYVAEQVGFADSAEDSATADSPLSDYQVKGVDNEALSGGLAGIVGALVVLLVVGGLTYVVRRKDRD
jgi:cobalt/nickel transport system permease protein/cobalt/nickel transport protein